MIHDPDWYNVALKIFLKNSEGKILALKCPPDSTMAGYYDFPGGRMNEEEFCEDYATIIKREVMEELGEDVQFELILKPVSFCRNSYYSRRQQKEIRIFQIYFEANYISGEINISKEHSQHKWLDLKNINLQDYFTNGPLEAVKRYTMNS